MHRIGTAHILVSVAAFSCLMPAGAQEPATLLARLDRFAPTFTGMKATIQEVVHTANIDKEETLRGTIVVKRRSPTKMHLMVSFAGSSSFALRDQTAEIYHPKLNEIEVYNIREYRDIAQTLMLLGFGMPGRELAANYEIREVRREVLGAQDTTHLELIPKSPEMLKRLQRAELWISEKTNCAVQQKFYTPDGDRVVQLSDQQINPQLPDSALEFPKNARRVKKN